LNYDEFVAFFNDLDDRNDVKAIFRDVNKHKEYMNFDTFRDFIINEQKVNKYIINSTWDKSIYICIYIIFKN